MLLAFHDAVAVGIPLDPGVLDGALDAGPELAQPIVTRAAHPLAIDLHNAAHLAVGRGMHFVASLPQGHGSAEAHAAIGPQIDQKIRLPHAALELRIEVRHGLLVVVDMRAVHGTAATVIVAAFEGERDILLQHHDGVGAQNRRLAGYGIDHRCRQRGSIECVAILLGTRAQRIELQINLKSRHVATQPASEIRVVRDADLHGAFPPQGHERSPGA